MTRRLLTGWGHTSSSAADVVDVAGANDARAAIDAPAPRGVLARGLGRSYGDAAQNAGGRVLQFEGGAPIDLDDATGIVTAEAGVSIDELLRELVPRGWFVPVTPGTRFVTIGGAVAADIHGKNHHMDGSWGNHVLQLELLLADGSVRAVSPALDADLFWATLGGMGLTTVVLRCTFQALRIESSRMLVDTVRCNDLDETMRQMDDHDADYRYSVAWLDVLATGAKMGRSVITFADHAPATAVAPVGRLDFEPRSPVPVPLNAPSRLLNSRTVGVFNELWHRRAPSSRTGELQSIGWFFHPLDLFGDWYRLYGRRGFVQYQFVVPFGAEATLRHAVERLAEGGAASFVTVLKRFGAANPGHLSFPMPGWTLTLDIPATVPGLGGLLDELDLAVVEAGGRVYLAKDSRLGGGLLASMYPRLEEWRAVCDTVDPACRFQSDLSRRLGLRAPAHTQKEARPR